MASDRGECFGGLPESDVGLVIVVVVFAVLLVVVCGRCFRVGGSVEGF